MVLSVVRHRSVGVRDTLFTLCVSCSLAGDLIIVVADQYTQVACSAYFDVYLQFTCSTHFDVLGHAWFRLYFRETQRVVPGSPGLFRLYNGELLPHMCV